MNCNDIMQFLSQLLKDFDKPEIISITQRSCTNEDTAIETTTELVDDLYITTFCDCIVIYKQ